MGLRRAFSHGGPAMDPHAHISYSPLSDMANAADLEAPGHCRLSGPDALRRNLSVAEFKGSALPGRPVFRPKKSRVVRWLVLHANGDKQILALDKRHLIQMFKLDVPIRDMRLLDSSFSNYETIGQISVRDNAIVFSMEHVKAMVMADKVFLPLEEDKNDVKERFILYLEQLVQERAAEMGQDSQDPFGIGMPQSNQGMHASMGGAFTAQSYDSSEVLPFELHVLEAALGEICNHLAREVDQLQAQAQPALEELTHNADQPTLERVRRIKTWHQRLLGRVKLVREVLERLMEDDGDMLRMCLTRTGLRRAATNLNHALSSGQAAAAAAGAAGKAHTSPCISREPTATGESSAADLSTSVPQLATSPSCQGGAAGQNTFSTPFSSSFLSMNLRRHGNVIVPVAPAEALDAEEAHDLLDVENLLESYFMLVDSTHQSLVSIGEYIDDTEDLINIQLDYSRNKLIRFEIILTTGTFAIAIFSAVAGMLGENLALPEIITENLWGFALVNVGVLLFCIVSYTAIVKVLIQRRLI